MIQPLIHERLHRVFVIDGTDWGMSDCVVIETDIAAYRAAFDDWVRLSEPAPSGRDEAVLKWAVDAPILRALTDGSALLLVFEGGVMWVCQQFDPRLVAPPPTSMERLKKWLGAGPRGEPDLPGFYVEFEDRAKFDEWCNPATMFDTRVITDL